MPQLISIPRRASPSLRTGYARSAAESEYPGLWDGLELAWVPALGGTGNIARDYNGKQNHADFEVITAADWEMSPIGPAITFNAAANALKVEYAAATKLPFTLVNYVKANDLTGSHPLLWMGNSGFSSYWCALQFRGEKAGDPFRTFYHNHGGAGSSFSLDTSFAYGAGDWHHLVGVFTGRPLCYSYYDGEFVGSTTAAIADPIGWDRTAFGRTYRSSPSGDLDGAMAVTMVYSRALSGPEIRILNADPVALFRPRHLNFAAGAPSTFQPAWARNSNILLGSTQ